MNPEQTSLLIKPMELDEFDEHLDNLLLEDGTDEKNDVTKGPKSRDKDYRSDKRGQWILTQRMRNYRSRTECRGDIQRLNLSFLTIYESLIPPNEEKEKQKQLMALLDKHVKKNGLKPGYFFMDHVPIRSVFVKVTLMFTLQWEMQILLK